MTYLPTRIRLAYIPDYHSRRSRVRHGNRRISFSSIRNLAPLYVAEHPFTLATWRDVLEGQICKRQSSPANGMQQSINASTCYCSTAISRPWPGLPDPFSSRPRSEDQGFGCTHTRSFWLRCHSMHDIAYPFFHGSSIFNRPYRRPIQSWDPASTISIIHAYRAPRLLQKNLGAPAAL